jgi:hypothetical protein
MLNIKTTYSTELLATVISIAERKGPRGARVMNIVVDLQDGWDDLSLKLLDAAAKAAEEARQE